MKIDTRIPIGSPQEIKEHALKMQNYISDITVYVNAYQYMVDMIDAELSLIRDKSFLKANTEESLTGKSIEYKKAYGKVMYKFKVEIKSPIKDDACKDIEGEFSYMELKKVFALWNYKLNRARNKMYEVKSIIETCNYYPINV